MKKEAVTDFLLTNIYNGDGLKMIVYKKVEKKTAGDPPAW